MLITTYSLGWIYRDDEKTQRFIQKNLKMNSINEECKIQIFGVVVDRFSFKS